MTQKQILAALDSIYMQVGVIENCPNKAARAEERKRVQAMVINLWNGISMGGVQ